MLQAGSSLTLSLPGYGTLERSSLPYWGLSGIVVAISPCFCADNRFCSHLRTGSIKYALKTASVVCRGSSGGQRRNSDFPKQNGLSFSENRNGQNEDGDFFDNNDESAPLISENRPLLSLPNTSKFQSPTPPPAPESEQEIVESFRNIQAALIKGARKKAEELERNSMPPIARSLIQPPWKKQSGINSDLPTDEDKQNGSSFADQSYDNQQEQTEEDLS